jgi:endonuclease/exonuclease/phosphatase family metal-dependent hydrolase
MYYELKGMTTTERTSETSVAPTALENVEVGSFAISSVPRTKIVIASYNIRYAVGSFLITGSLLRRLKLARPQRRRALIGRHLHQTVEAFSNGARLPRADIIALQEADKETSRAGGHDIACELARALCMNYARATADTIARGETPKTKQWYLDFEEPIAPTERGDTGVALLSRLPFASVSRIELPFAECAWRPRLALAATVCVGEKTIHIFNAHIDPHASLLEQLAQHEAILARASEFNENHPVVLLGDFNTLSKRACVEMRRALEAHGYSTPFKTRTATWRAGLIRLHTDWIFVRGARVTKYGVARGLGMSDHWPIWIEVDLASGA